MCCAVHDMERRRHDVHLPVADHDVAVAAETFHIPVLVNVIMIRVHKIAVAYHQINHRETVAVRLPGITAEDVVDVPTIVEPSWHLAVAVEAGVPARIGQALKFVAVRVLDNSEIRVAVPSTYLKWLVQFR
jgi:hypothetical protein